MAKFLWLSSIYGSSVEPVKTKDLVLGTIPSVSYKTLILDLQSGGLLLLMTDGIPNLGVPRSDAQRNQVDPTELFLVFPMN